MIGERVLNFTFAPSPDSHRHAAGKWGRRAAAPCHRFLLFKFFVFLSRPFAVQFFPHAGGMRISTTMGVAVDDVLFLTTKGTEITKFSDVFIFVPFVLSVVKNS